MVANQATNAREHMTSDVGRPFRKWSLDSRSLFLHDPSKKESLYICVDCIFIYTWNLFVFYFLQMTPPKQGLFPSKQGSFGFQVYIYYIYMHKELDP